VDVRDGLAAPTLLVRGTGKVPSREERGVKYIILLYGSQEAYDAMAGKTAAGKPAVSPEDFVPMYEFMESWNNALVESGEFVDAQGLARRYTRGESS